MIFSLNQQVHNNISTFGLRFVSLVQLLCTWTTVCINGVAGNIKSGTVIFLFACGKERFFTAEIFFPKHFLFGKSLKRYREMAACLNCGKKPPRKSSNSERLYTLVSVKVDMDVYVKQSLVLQQLQLDVST